ncbi:methyl-accepting chemotaxis protein [Peptococcaceae bacterium 1198_IL3148]
MKFKTKLMLSSASILFLLMALGIFCMQQIQNVNQSYNDLLNNQEKIKSVSNQLVKNFEYSALYMRSYLFTSNPEYQTRYQEALANAEGNLKSLQSMVSDNQGKQKVNELKQALEQYNDYVNQGLAVMAAGPDAVVDFTLNKKGTINSIITIATELANMQDNAMAKQLQNNNQKVDGMRKTVTIATICSIFFGLFITLVQANKITKPILMLEQQVGKLSQGDLTGESIRVTTKDEVGTLTDNFNRMKDNLLQMVAGISTTAKGVVKSSEIVADTSQQLSAGTEVIATTMNQIAVTSENVAQDAKAVSNAADDTAKLASEGSQGLDKVQQHMDSINVVSSQVAEAISNLNKRTREISLIVDMITEIAEQTNLLALNATIEAARAGEQGKGFAVVAEEVRKLAESSAKAAQQIYQMINNIKQESEQAVDIMKNSSHEIINSKQVIDEVGSNFREIIGKVQVLANQVQAVAGSAEEISSAVQNVTSISQEQTSSMQQLSSLADELNRMAGELNNMTSDFRIS